MGGCAPQARLRQAGVVNHIDRTRQWLQRNTSREADWPLDRLLRLKKESAAQLSVVLPALDEEATVGAIVRAIVADLAAPGLVDEVVVVDSGSTDATARLAAAAGARVVRREEVLPGLPVRPGKGEALWRSLAATCGDVVCFVDADLLEFNSSVVRAVVGPVLAYPGVQLVKAAYERPLANGDTVHPAGGGRVTELVARPLLNLYWPELAGVVQPLGGEYAGRRSLLESLPFPCGYGVEFGLLVDTYQKHGLDAIAQVDAGVRRHRHQDDLALGRMAAEIIQVAMDRLGSAPPAATVLTQFSRTAAGFVPSARETALVERPALDTLRAGTGFEPSCPRKD